MVAKPINTTTSSPKALYVGTGSI